MIKTLSKKLLSFCLAIIFVLPFLFFGTSCERKAKLKDFELDKITEDYAVTIRIIPKVDIEDLELVAYFYGDTKARNLLQQSVHEIGDLKRQREYTFTLLLKPTAFNEGKTIKLVEFEVLEGTVEY